MKIAILVLLLVALSFATTTIQFSGNVSNVNGVIQDEFKYRSTTVWAIPITIPLIGSVTVAGYASVGITASGNNQSGMISGDLIIGAIKFVTGVVPCSYMSYLNAQVTAAKQLSSVAGVDVTTFNYQGSAGFILTSYLRLLEKDSSGNVARTVELKNLVWTVSTGNSTGGLYYITLVASNSIFSPQLQSGESISMTFIISEVLGEVTFGSVSVAVTPKTLESVVEISSWNYKSPSNNLALVMGVATGSATGDSTGVVTLASGSGDDQVYADFSRHVDVSGSLQSVQVTKTATTNFTLITDDASVQATANSVYSGNYNLANVVVSFPAGAAKITYDPTIGSGSPIAQNAAAGVYFFTLLISLVVLLI